MPPSVFTIFDTSPTIQYSPFADTLSTPNLTAGWNPYFTSSAFATSLGQEGQGTSQHITSLEGAGLAVQWFGTGIQLYGNITNNANYSVLVDGAPVPINATTSATGGLLFSLFGIPQASHLLSLTVGIGALPGRPMNTSMLVFDSALVQYSDEHDTQPTNQTLPDNNIDFRGNWSTHADISSRVSTEQGDTARIQFLGQAFFLTGTTSPTSGNYSITLDNATALTYSAQSSFTAHDSLLFYATGLLGNMTHDIILRNEGGGELGVANGGWGVRADGPILPTPIQPSPPPTTTASAVGASTSFPKGTIAAFALAGILAFLLLSGILFFFLIYRPRRQHKRQMRASERYSRSAWGEGEGGMKERERLTLNTAVLDIRHPLPHGEGQGEEGEDLVPMRGQRDSTKSGFARWKREMQDTRLRNGIMFRHSDSVPRQSAMQREGTTASSKSKSSSSKFSITSSFKVRKAWTKKGKQRAVSGQSGQSQRKQSQRYSQRYSQRQKAYALDFPLKEASPVEKKEDEELGEPSESHESGIATLSYVSTPSSPKPPLYSFAGLGLRSKASKKKMAGNASPPSGPRTVSESTGSATVGHEVSSPSHQQQQQRGIQLKPIRRQDRGSVLPEEEERESERGVLGPATARAALRGLSPRTSQRVSASFGVQGERPRTAEAAYPPMLEGRHAYALVDEPRRPQSAMPLQQQQQLQQGRKPRGPRGLPVPPIQTSNFDSPRALADAPVTALQPTSKVTSPDEVVEVNNGVFLSVRELSPFRIDFPSRPVSGVIGEKRAPSRPVSVVGVTSPSTRVSGLSHVRFDPNTADVGEARRASFGNLLGGSGAEQQQQPDFVQGSSGLFRLTPLTAMQPPSIEGSPSPPESSSAGVTSFLDLTHSSDVSLRSRSLRTTDSQERDRAWEMLKAEAREKSRWSMTTGPSMAPAAHEHEQSAGEGSNISQGSSTFPIPFQVNMPSPPPSARPESYSSTSHEGGELHVHPVMGNIEDPSSPTESIPFSVSDLNFRRDSGSESDTREASDSQFPSHPPLPGSDVSTPMSTPNFIFQRALGMTPPTSSRPTQSSYPYFGSPLQPLRGYHTDSSRSNTGLDNSR